MANDNGNDLRQWVEALVLYVCAFLFLALFIIGFGTAVHDCHNEAKQGDERLNLLQQRGSELELRTLEDSVHYFEDGF